MVIAGVVAGFMAGGMTGCAPPTGGPPLEDDPNALKGELVTYVADFFEDGHSERWQALRPASGPEIRLDFDVPPTAALNGALVRVRGDLLGQRMHVNALEVVAPAVESRSSALTDSPDLVAAPAMDSYGIVLVDTGMGVNITAAQAQTLLFSSTPTDKSFATYYSESSYGKYMPTGSATSVLGPFTFSLASSCDTTGMFQAIEPMITGTFNHLIYYFNRASTCSFGGLGEEGNVAKPAKRTWMNGSLSCVVLMQEPGHNLGLMHANTIKCGTESFSTTPSSSCTITEYSNSMSTMGSGCKVLSGYERWYMQWMSGCNGVKVPGNATVNLLPLETPCPGGVQVLQVPFPAALTVNDPQATTTTVNLRNYYLDLRTAAGSFDTFGRTGGAGGGVTFTGPTVFVYVSDDVKTAATNGRVPNSVWTELLNMTPTTTAFAGLSTAGQTFVDPQGGPTITLQSISATGATISITNPKGSGSPTCIDGTTLQLSGPTACGGPPATGAGGTSGGMGGAGGVGGAAGAGGAGGAGGAAGAGGAGGAAGTGGATGTGGAGGGPVTTGTGGSGPKTGAGGYGGTPADSGVTITPIHTTGAAGSSGEVPPVTGGCACSMQPVTAGSSAWALFGLALAGVIARRRRR
jgi:MYXO-CTERM domain-containing protein